MPRILLIKTSSMGDVVHNLPVVNDIASAFPEMQIDWVVEQAFAAIPALHPGLRRVIPVALRRWRAHLLDLRTRREFGEFRRALRESIYDAVIDTQGLLKSAVLARMARGTRHGLDWRSSREPLRLFYDRTYPVPWSMHAVERNRMLASKALGYLPQAQPDYGIAVRDGDFHRLAGHFPGNALGRAYAVLLHATSAGNKEWPEQNWVGFGRHLAAVEVQSVLPFGTPAERARSERLAAQIPGALMPPALGLDLLAALLSRARVAVGVDTGLTHLAAALGRPTIGIYCATDPAATGLYGSPRALNLGGVGRVPDVADVFAAWERLQEGA